MLPSQLPDVPLIALDTETSALHPDDGLVVSVVSVAWADDNGVITSLAWPFGQGRTEQTRKKIPEDMLGVEDIGIAEWDALCDWLLTRQALVLANAKFDLMALTAGAKNGGRGINIDPDRVVWDTMLATKELWPNAPLALKDMAAKLWPEEDPQAEKNALKPYLGPQKDPRYDLVPWKIMKPYAVKDTELTMRLYLRQVVLASEGLAQARFIGRELDVMKCLHKMELKGLPFDVELAREVEATLTARIEKLEAELPFDPLDAKKYYFAKTSAGGLGLTPINRTPTGLAQMTSETVAKMVEKGYPHADTLQTLNQSKTALSKWYKPYIRTTNASGRIRPTFRQIASGWGEAGGTVSGRFSAERVNLMAIPQNYRVKIGLPSPRDIIKSGADKLDGWSLWELDQAQAELRVGAWLAGCKPMLQAFDEGRDLHGETAQKLFNASPDDDDWTIKRHIGKVCNFSLGYMAGPGTFAAMLSREGIEMPFYRVQSTVYAWRELYPEYVHISQVEDTKAKTLGYTTLANGKQRWYRPDENTFKAWNQRVQGSIAEVNKDWLRASTRLLEPVMARNPNAGLLLTVHDSQVMLLPDDEAEDIANAVVAEGLKIWNRYFPRLPGGLDKKKW